MSGGETRLGYSFTPLPERALEALAAGRLDYENYALIAFVYERADTSKLERREETPALPLWRIRDGIGWTLTDDALSKRLRGLRDDAERWFSYRTEWRKRRVLYVFTLHPDAPGRSEVGPRFETALGPRSGAMGHDATSGVPTSGDPDDSEIELDDERPNGPDSVSFDPRFETVAKDDGEPKPTVATSGVFRDAQTSQREQDLLVTERFEERSLDQDHVEGETDDDRLIALVGETNGNCEQDDGVMEALERARRAQARTEIDWPDNTGLDSESAILADAQVLVVAGLAEWVEESEA